MMTSFLMHAKTHFGMILRIINLSFTDFKDEEKMEKIPDLLIPMHKQLVKDIIDNIMIDDFFELFGENIVIFIQN